MNWSNYLRSIRRDWRLTRLTFLRREDRLSILNDTYLIIINLRMQRIGFVYSHLSKDDLKGKDNILDKLQGKSLKGKTIVVTGGSRGIGLAIALR